MRWYSSTLSFFRALKKSFSYEAEKRLGDTGGTGVTVLLVTLRREPFAERMVSVCDIPDPGIPIVRVILPFDPRVTRAPLTPTDVLTPLGLKVMRTPGIILILFLILNPMLEASFPRKLLVSQHFNDISISSIPHPKGRKTFVN